MVHNCLLPASCLSWLGFRVRVKPCLLLQSKMCTGMGVSVCGPAKVNVEGGLSVSIDDSVTRSGSRAMSITVSRVSCGCGCACRPAGCRLRWDSVHVQVQVQAHSMFGARPLGGTCPVARAAQHAWNACTCGLWFLSRRSGPQASFGRGLPPTALLDISA